MGFYCNLEILIEPSYMLKYSTMLRDCCTKKKCEITLTADVAIFTVVQFVAKCIFDPISILEYWLRISRYILAKKLIRILVCFPDLFKFDILEVDRKLGSHPNVYNGQDYTNSWVAANWNFADATIKIEAKLKQDVFKQRKFW